MMKNELEELSKVIASIRKEAYKEIKPEVRKNKLIVAEGLEECLNTKIKYLKLTSAFDPRMWTKDQSDAWHKNIPDFQKAFQALLEVSTRSTKEVNDDESSN